MVLAISLPNLNNSCKVLASKKGGIKSNSAVKAKVGISLKNLRRKSEAAVAAALNISVTQMRITTEEFFILLYVHRRNRSFIDTHFFPIIMESNGFNVYSFKQVLVLFI